MFVSRRKILMATAGLGIGLSTHPTLAAPRNIAPLAELPPISLSPENEKLLDEIQRRTFDYFWKTTNPKTGLALDRYPSSAVSSTAAIGFAFNAYCIGAHRGFVSREDAAMRVLETLRTLFLIPQGNGSKGFGGAAGFFYHFLNSETGLREGKNEISTIDTAILMAGILFAQNYFDGQSEIEISIRQGAELIFNRVAWNKLVVRPPFISHGWSPELQTLQWDWGGYNEGMLVYILGIGADNSPLDPKAWNAWCSTYDNFWGGHENRRHLQFGPLFGHQYTHVWIDFKGIQDKYMSAKGIDYFENSRRATYQQRDYANLNPNGFAGYSSNLWGLSACDGPGDVKTKHNGKNILCRGYSARGTVFDEFDDGTIAPTAAISSLPFAPEIVIDCINNMLNKYGKHIYGEFGFKDAFNPSFTETGKNKHGEVIDDEIWVGTDYLGIDQGPIISMIENYRSGLIWQKMQKSKYIINGLKRAGFKGGWLEQE